MLSRIAQRGLALASLCLYWSCSSGESVGPGEIPVATVNVSLPRPLVRMGESLQATVSVLSATAASISGKPVAWSSSNASVATVSGSGIVTAVAPGSATITATAEGKAGQATLQVTLVPVASVTVTPENTSVPVGQAVVLAAAAKDSGGNTLQGRAVTWVSTDASRGAVSQVPGEQRFSTISAGGSHVCALSLTSGTYCWGSNYLGQLGNGTLVNTSAPVRVIGGHDFVSIAAGDYSTCATNATREIYCWGGKIDAAQPGVTFYESRIVSVVDPKRIPGRLVAVIGAGIGQVDPWQAGERYCGVDDSGLAYCWNRNTIQGAYVGPTTPLSTTLRFTTLRMGLRHVCGITTEKQTFCTGDNTQGQLGDGTATFRDNMVRISDNFEFESLGAGATHTCGRTAAGVTHCWGSNGSGQLGTGVSGGIRTIPTSVAGPATFTGITGRTEFTCGLAVGGAAYCWGNNANRQLGNGTNASVNVPTQVFGN